MSLNYSNFSKLKLFFRSIQNYYLDLLNHRDISNEIALHFKVQHQSPQILLLKNRAVVYDTSHENIDATELKKYL